MSKATPSAIATGNAIKQLREEAAEKARHKLVYETIPSLEQVIAGTPTGPRRDKLTEANILLHQIVAE